MERVRIVRDAGTIAIVDIVGERFPVLPERPDLLVRLGALEELPDGRKIGTGQRQLDGITRNVAWFADEDEVHRIDREWREAIAKSSILLTPEVLDDLFA